MNASDGSSKSLSPEGALVVVVAVATVAVMGPITIGLAVLLVVSYAWVTTGALRAGDDIAVPALVAVAVQGAHFGEELVAGFYRDFPGLAGGEPWSVARFAGFNLAWLFVFALAAALPWRRSRLGLTTLTFLGLGAGVVNGVAHVLLSLARGAYFPGLATAPFCALAGAWLLARLRRDTSAR